MKKYILFIICFSFNFGISQIVNIPDINFKAKLLAANTTTSTIAAYGIYPNIVLTEIDTNHDGQIQNSEAEVITYLILIASGINDLTGIEAFTNLTVLRCDNNNLANVDISQLIHLEYIVFYQNQLTSLDVSNLTALKTMDCTYNQITSLNFTNNPLLEKVFCSNNLVSDLDFSNNPLFNELDCYNNPNLTSVNIHNGATQLLGPQTYYNQCWTGCPNLTRICADSGELLALENYLDSCNIDINTITFTSNCALDAEEFGFININVAPNPNNGTFTINSQEDYDIAIYDVVGKLVYEKNNASQTIVTNLKQGLYLVKIKQQNEIVKTLKMAID